MVASTIVKKASDDRDHEKVYRMEWRRLLFINLPPSSKAYVAEGVEKQDDTAKGYIPSMKAYLAAKPDDIHKAETLFFMALIGKMPLPEREAMSDLKVGPEVVADIALMMARNGSVPAEMRTAFVKEFMGKWDDTEAATLFTGYQKDGLDKVPASLPFEK